MITGAAAGTAPPAPIVPKILVAALGTVALVTLGALALGAVALSTLGAVALGAAAL